MLESMTGAASASFRVARAPFQIWLRSINHRFFEVQMRCPPVLHKMERQLEDLLRARLRRGRIEVEIEAGDAGAMIRPRMNRKLAREYMGFARDLAGAAGDFDVTGVLRLPGVVQLVEELPAGFDGEAFLRQFRRAVEQLQKARLREGREIETLFRGYLKNIQDCGKKIRRRHGAYKKEHLRRMRRELRGVLPEDALKQGVDWLERHDIDEEVERLDMHIKAVRELMAGKDLEAGKQIEFFAQEMLREANTVASKSRDFEIRREVVEIKTAIEHMKEQVRNVC